MPAPGDITRLTAGDELRTCPACGYELGFHTSFLRYPATKKPAPSGRQVYGVILICPECGARYDAGWRISFEQPEKNMGGRPVPPS